MKNSLMLENSVLTLYSTVNDGTNRLIINNTLIPSSNWVGTGTYTFQNITIHKAAALTGNLMLQKITDYEYFFVNVGLKKIYASEVIFDGSESGIAADNVQDAIDAIFGKIYPIGALYFSTVDVNPGTFLGGTWERWGAGRVVTGYDSTDSDFNAAEKTGGLKNKTLSTTEIPSHNHSVGAHSHGLNSHKHSVSAHSHGLNSHTHTIPKLSGTAASNGSHSHGTDYAVLYFSGSGGNILPQLSSVSASNTNLKDYGMTTKSGGSHTHSVETVANTTGQASGSTANSAAFDTGAASGNTANSSAFDSGNTGGGNSFSLLQPYITCFIWKRTA
jgi:hypothetical protein